MGQVSRLDALRPEPRSLAAARYVERAREALDLLSALEAPAERAAVCGITETWLSLAEAELARPNRR